MRSGGADGGGDGAARQPELTGERWRSGAAWGARERTRELGQLGKMREGGAGSVFIGSGDQNRGREGRQPVVEWGNNVGGVAAARRRFLRGGVGEVVEDEEGTGPRSLGAGTCAGGRRIRRDVGRGEVVASGLEVWEGHEGEREGAGRGMPDRLLQGAGRGREARRPP